MTQTVLVVCEDPVACNQIVRWVRSAGFQATGAVSFNEASRLMRTSPPAVLVTTVRLGAFNGLHLVVRARFEHPTTRAIVIHPTPDPVLRADTESFGASSLVEPLDVNSLLSLIADRCERGTPAVGPSHLPLRVTPESQAGVPALT